MNRRRFFVAAASTLAGLAALALYKSQPAVETFVFDATDMCINFGKKDYLFTYYSHGKKVFSGWNSSIQSITSQSGGPLGFEHTMELRDGRKITGYSYAFHPIFNTSVWEHVSMEV